MQLRSGPIKGREHEGTAPGLEGRLPEVVIEEVLEYATASDLARAGEASAWFRRSTAKVVVRRLGRWPHAARAGCRALRSLERLERRVGARAPGSAWRDDWVGLQYAKVRRSLAGQPYARAYLERMHELRDELAAHWRAGGEHAPDASVEYVRSSVEWKVSRGWPRDLAEGYTLTMTNFKAVLGDAFERRSREFAASAHLLVRAFALRAPLEAVAPECYNDLDGTYGLRRHDAAWAALSPDAPLGTTFETRAPLEASASPSCLTEEGFRAPVINVGESDAIVYEPQDSDIIEFNSRPTDGRGFHSLVRTAETAAEAQYDLPPLARVTLVGIEEPGAWVAFGTVAPNRRLYRVEITFL